MQRKFESCQKDVNEILQRDQDGKFKYIDNDLINIQICALDCKTDDEKNKYGRMQQEKQKYYLNNWEEIKDTYDKINIKKEELRQFCKDNDLNNFHTSEVFLEAFMFDSQGNYLNFLKYKLWRYENMLRDMNELKNNRN